MTLELAELPIKSWNRYRKHFKMLIFNFPKIKILWFLTEWFKDRFFTKIFYQP